jgi:hypothetical protein
MQGCANTEKLPTIVKIKLGQLKIKPFLLSFTSHIDIVIVISVQINISELTGILPSNIFRKIVFSYYK